MSRRGEVRVSRHLSPRDERPWLCRTAALAAALALALLAAGAAAAFAAGCGGSARAADLTPFAGRWERVEAGAPNPDLTLAIELRGNDVRITFADRANGMSQTVAGKAHEGGIACSVPNAGAATGAAANSASRESASPSPSGVPAGSDLLLSLDESGQLVVDSVLTDGTLEPVWIYQRSESGSPSPPGTL